MKRINPKLENHILNQILLGYPYPDIANKTGVAVSTIKKIKARNKQRYETGKRELVDFSVEEAKSSLRRAYKLLDRVLVQGEAGEQNLSVKEIILIANQMFIQSEIQHIVEGREPLFRKQQQIKDLMAQLKK